MKFDLDDILKIIKEVGFPIAIAVFLLWKTSASVDALAIVLLETKENISYLNSVIVNRCNPTAWRESRP
jgi:hypothetical protein